MRAALIRRSGNLIQVFPAVKELLCPLLTYKKRVQESGNAKEARYETVELWKVHDDSLVTPAGFTARVSQALRRAGFEIKYEDYRTHTLPEPDFTRLDNLREGQDEIICSIAEADCGVIEAPTGSGKGFVLRQMCKIWYTANIIICSPFTDIIRQTYQELKELVPFDEVGMIGAGRNEVGRRISCVVDRSLMKCDLEKCQIFIFDEVHRAAAPCTAEALARVRNARMFGFSASPYGRSDRADLETEGFFGPRICSVSYQEVQKTGSIVPIHVLLYDTPHFDMVTAATTSALERRGLWRNEHRNMLIAKVVRNLQQTMSNPQIMVAVKTVEHAVFLGKHLPDFQLVYGSMSTDKRNRWANWNLIKKEDHPLSSRRREELYNEFRSGALKTVIATGVWLTGVDFPGLNVLVRADGQSSDIQNTQIPGRVTRSADGKEAGIIVDFMDTFNETLKRRSEKRVLVYRRKGWTIHGMTEGTRYMTE